MEEKDVLMNEEKGREQERKKRREKGVSERKKERGKGRNVRGK